jgi:hypothetical protein
MSQDRSVEWDHGGRVVVGWVLVEALMRAVVIEMVHVLVEDGAGGLGGHTENVHPAGAYFHNK